MNELEAWALSDKAIELLLQFRRPDRQLEGLPGIRDGLPDEVAALILGVTPARLHQSLDGFARQVNDAAAELREQESLAQDIETVRHHLSGSRIVCLGDSITADRRSWAELLAVMLAPEVEVLNRGRAGDTTTDLVNRFRLSVEATHPDLVIILTGTNDARRYRASTTQDTLGPMVLSDEATLAGARELDRLTRAVTGRPARWLTPPPVSPYRLARHPSPQAARAHWGAEAISTKGHLLHTAFREQSCNLEAVYRALGDADELLMPDGLHPNLAGQKTIAAAALSVLSRSVRAESGPAGGLSCSATASARSSTSSTWSHASPIVR